MRQLFTGMHDSSHCLHRLLLECGPMPNVLVALPNIGGALCSTLQSLADVEGVGHFELRFQGEGVIAPEYFLVSRKLDTFCYLTVQTAVCYVQSF